ncbi:MAG: hypothetical protein EXR97_02060 [Nitrospiraceae bacterium]|nr:hypothetical protein [Nitrospiraceae bacterium]MSR24894.1 hypothetical protein [Nitrospiraceae bacterium]
MNTKRLALASLAVFAVFSVVDGVVNNVLLADLYKQTASVWRPESEIQGNLWLMGLGTLILAPLFVLIYTKGYEANKPGLGQGVRYGLIVGVLLFAPQCLAWYAVLPISAMLPVWWFAAGMVESIAAGAATGLIYRIA